MIFPKYSYEERKLYYLLKDQFIYEYLPLIVPFLSINILIKLPVAIIASTNAKTLLNNINTLPTQDIEMNDIAQVNEDETEPSTNKSD